MKATLRTKIEEISDDFQSTFMPTNKDNVLQNMIGDDEFDELEKVILKHVPTAKLEFKKIQEIGTRSMYLIIDHNVTVETYQ